MTGSSFSLLLNFWIHWESGWHVGSGYGDVQTDRLIRRRGGRGGTPYVPGSQLKGVLRNQAERIATSLGRAVLPPHAIDAHQVDLVRNFWPLKQSPMIVDRLFGSRFQGECLFVDDVVPGPSASRPAGSTLHYTRTSIDRLTGTVKEGRLFTIEAAGETTDEFTGTIRAFHPHGSLLPNEEFPLEYSLLVCALGSIEILGGNKSVGMGRCLVRIEEPITWRRDGAIQRPRSLSETLAVFELDEWDTYVDLYENQART